MANKCPSKLVEELFNLCDTSTPPAIGVLRNALMTIKTAVEALESGSGASDLAQKNETLNAELDAVKKQIETVKNERDALQKQIEIVKSNYATQIEILRKELDVAGEEKAKREYDEKTNLPEIQTEILKTLSTHDEGITSTFPEVCARFPKFLPDEISCHLGKLLELKLITRGNDLNKMGAVIFMRSAKGNEHVIARRLAEAQKGENASRPRIPDLAAMEEKILMLLIGQRGGVAVSVIHQQLEKRAVKLTLAKLEHTLRQLEKNGFLWESHQAFSGGNNDWLLTEKGTQYLAERDKL